MDEIEKALDEEMVGIDDVPTIRVQVSGIYALLKERNQLRANLGQVQARCTELLLENRELKKALEARDQQLAAGTQVLWTAEEYEPGCWRAKLQGNDALVGHGPTTESAIADLRRKAWALTSELEAAEAEIG